MSKLPFFFLSNNPIKFVFLVILHVITVDATSSASFRIERLVCSSAGLTR